MRVFYLSKSTSLYDLILILIYYMIIPREGIDLLICRAVYRVDRTATQKLELAIFLYISWVFVSSVTSRCISNTTSKYVVH